MRKTMILLFAILSTPTVANIVTLPAKPIVGINASEVGKRVCYYQDAAYSEGAIIQIGEYYMTCSAANDYETNGTLNWHRVDENQATESTHSDNSSKPVKRYSVK